jgi:hypothetical protein
MHAVISEEREELVELCRRTDAVRPEVFGSAAHGTDFDPLHSDADFLVEFRRADGRAPLRQYFDFAEALRHALGRPSGNRRSAEPLLARSHRQIA